MEKEIHGTARSHDGAVISYVYYPAKTKNPALIMSNGVVCIETYWVPLVKHLRGRYPLITWDYRGHGRSPVPDDLESVSVENHARDAAAVLDTLGIEKAVHGGFSMGVQVAFEFFRQFSDRTLGIVAACGPFGHPYTVFFGSPVLAQALNKLLDLALKINHVIEPAFHSIIGSPIAFPLAKLIQVDRRVRREDMQSYFDHLSTVNVQLGIHALKKMEEHTAEDVLPTVDVPTLIIAGAKDSMTPLFHQEQMHELTPKSELMVLPFGTHAAPIEYPEAINLRIEVFLRDHFNYESAAAKEAHASHDHAAESGKRA